MPKAHSTPRHVDLAMLRWKSAQKPDFKNRFLYSMPRQPSVEQCGTAEEKETPSRARIITLSYSPSKPTASPVPPATTLNSASTNRGLSHNDANESMPTSGAQYIEMKSIPKPANLTIGRFEPFLQWSKDLGMPLKDQKKEQLAILTKEVILATDYPHVQDF
ncbi:hypothetical protein JR316_0005321 [Psilocybe cubensis]|uniref:Uncharacterized protein n=1 Tax=Psilocybe cubensis TaxID=181762 RepID=A0ACB8H6A2_PSICU|nr:hypothetical protein JR316_0005321 [Psilocybe cubensis]KAH9483217.1 hypothetical protein JR316_0005321 [Psilocybe cubensis]